jgi:hypothetical protein
MIYKRVIVLLIVSAVMLSACSASTPAPVQNIPASTDAPTTAALQPTNAILPAQTEVAATVSADSPTPKNVQPALGNGDAKCLVGTWAIADFDSFVRAILPTGAFDDNSLQYDSTEGRILYIFSEGGTVTVKAQHYSTLFNVSVDPVDMKLAVTMDGTTSGTYSVKGSRVSVDKVTDDQMSFAAVLDGAPMLTTNKLAEVGPLFVPPNNYADFQCSVDKLSLVIPNLPSSVSAVNFKRLGN